MKTNVILLLLILSFGCKTSKMETMNTDIEYQFPFALDKYLGTWYEIARYDHSFERNLEGVTATYSLREDGKIQVLNQGFKDSLNGKKSVAVGKAKINNAEDPRRLKVSFFWIFYSDYFILELDEKYEVAVIGTSSPKYLWILSRNPKLNEDDKSSILNKISKRGYDTSKLIWVQQPTLN